MIYASRLTDRAILALRGEEARDFLQGLITNDISSCTEDQPIYAALLTPQGKILFDFFVALESRDCLLIDCAASHANDLTKRLSLYRLRAKVEINARPELSVAAIWNVATNFRLPPEVTTFIDPRHRALGQRAIATPETLNAAIRDFTASDYQTHRLALGVPDSADLAPDSVFALDAGLEELNGVSFKKGCYIGQEVTARMKHRGTARRRFVIAQSDGEIPPAGTSLESEGRELGTLASGRRETALALVRLDRLTEAETKHALIMADGHAIRLKRPGWFRG